MGELHELIAVESNKKEAWKKALDAIRLLFTEKRSVFQAGEKSLHPLADELGEAEVVDQHAMMSTVERELDGLRPYLGDYLDALYQKDRTNTVAIATFAIDSTMISGPATFFLSLEQKLIEIRSVIEKIPVHADGYNWKSDEAHEFKGVQKLDAPEITFKTKKVLKPFVLYEATKDHPAQVDKLSEDVNVGRFFTQRWSGMVTRAQKQGYLDRINKAIEEAKRARMEANRAEASTEKMAGDLLNYLFGE